VSGPSESSDNLKDNVCLWLLGTEGPTEIVVVLSFRESHIRGTPVEDTINANSNTEEQTLIKSINQSTTQSNLAQMLEQLNQHAMLKKQLIGDLSATVHLFPANKDYMDIEEFFISTVLPLPVSDSAVRSLEVLPSNPSILAVLASKATLLPERAGSVRSGPGPSWGPAGGLPRARDETGQQDMLRPRLSFLLVGQL